MKSSSLKGIGWLVLTLLLLGVVARFIHADRYHDPIQTALSAALGRDVAIGEVTLDLFTGPGFRVSNVVIADAPGRSAEPFAYVDSVYATPRLSSLWSGRLEFSSLVLSDAHVNLARIDRGREAPVWNFETLLRPGLLEAFPAITIRDSRINFKLNGQKSPFYLLNTNLDISPRDVHGRHWSVNFTGEPARTDRPAHGFGAIEAKGTWLAASGAPGNLEMDVHLQRSELGDVVALFNGHDVGVGGLLSSTLHIVGRLDSLGVEGNLRVSDLHGWDQSPLPGGTFNFRVSGTANTPAQRFELFAEPRDPLAGITAHVVGQNYFHTPEWMVELRSVALPVDTFPGLFRNFGIKLPEGLGVSGIMQSDVRYQAPGGWQGHAVIQDAVLELKNLPALHFDQAAIEMNAGILRAAPIEMTSGADTIGTVAASYSIPDGAFEVDLASSGGPLTPLLETFPVAAVPLLSALKAGNWSGNLRYVQPASAPGAWSGNGVLTDALAHLPILSEPLHILNARVRIDSGMIQMDQVRLQAGSIDAGGDYSYLPGVSRPHQFHLTMDTADLSDLEALFAPALKRQSNLFAIALSLGRTTLPDWLRSLHAAGAVQISELQVGTPGVALQRVRTRVQWDGPTVALSEWQSRLDTASLQGHVALSLRASEPIYSAALRLTGMPWQNGTITGSVRAQTSGMGTRTLTNLKMNGTFEARNLELEPLGAFDRVTGAGEMVWRGEAPQLLLKGLQLIGRDDTWTGTGQSQGANGDVLLQLSSRGRQMTVAGSLLDPAKNWVER